MNPLPSPSSRCPIWTTAPEGKLGSSTLLCLYPSAAAIAAFYVVGSPSNASSVGERPSRHSTSPNSYNNNNVPCQRPHPPPPPRIALPLAKVSVPSSRPFASALRRRRVAMVVASPPPTTEETSSSPPPRGRRRLRGSNQRGSPPLSLPVILLLCRSPPRR